MADRTSRATSGPGGAHGAHDVQLVARFTAGDAGTGEASRARELLTACPECAALAADLRAIAAASRGLAAAHQSSPAPRDFRISQVQAERIRRRGPASWSAALATAAGLLRARGAAGLVALGLVGIIVGTGFPGALTGGAGIGAQAPEAAVTKDLAAPAPAFAPLAGASDQPGGTPDPLRVTTVAPSGGPAGAPGPAAAATAGPAGAVGPAGPAGAAGLAPADATPGTDTLMGAAAAAADATAPETSAATVPAVADPTGSLLLIGASALILAIGLAGILLGRKGRRARP